MKKLSILILAAAAGLTIAGCDSLGNGMNTSKVRDMNSNSSAMMPSPTPMMNGERENMGSNMMNSNSHYDPNMMNANMHSNSGGAQRLR